MILIFGPPVRRSAGPPGPPVPPFRPSARPPLRPNRCVLPITRSAKFAKNTIQSRFLFGKTVFYRGSVLFTAS